MIVASLTHRERPSDDAVEASPSEPSSLSGRLGAGSVYVDSPAAMRALAGCTDGSIARAYCGGLVHRLSRADGEGLFAACFRILKPRGAIRIVTVDLDQIIHGYLFDWAGDEAGASRTQRLNAAWRAPGVEYLYGEEELTALLTRVGFADIRRFGVGASADERFWRLASDHSETLILEATKP